MQNKHMEVLIFIAGAAGYAGIEYLFRGYTHWSMALTGGACLLAFYWYTREAKSTPLLVKAAAGAWIVTIFEFCVGMVVNVWLDWHVWDYSRESGNLMGQICPLFSFAWFLLCLGVLVLFSALDPLLLFFRGTSWYNTIRNRTIFYRDHRRIK